jgi:hypothetical protein
MKSVLLVALAAFVVPVSSGFAQYTVEITQVPYRETHAFMGVYYEMSGVQNVMRVSDSKSLALPQVGFGLRMMSAKDRNIQGEFEIAYRRMDMKGFQPASTDPQVIGVGSFLFGGRFYPRYPTFGLGKSIGVRVTASAAGGYGMDMSDNGYDNANSGVSHRAVSGFDVRTTAGLVFSGRTDPSGVTAEVVYRPVSMTGERYSMDPSWNVRLGFQFAP